MITRIMAFIFLSIFGIAYLSKSYWGSRQGIKTNCCGSSGKPAKIRAFETAMFICNSVTIAVCFLSAVFGGYELPLPLRIAGGIMALCADIIFITAVVGMKKSWRAGIPDSDDTELITGGIYSLSRNPAFLAFDLLYFGVTLMVFSIPLPALSAVTAILLHIQIINEEKYLEGRFGEEYISYKKRVRRYL